MESIEVKSPDSSILSGMQHGDEVQQHFDASHMESGGASAVLSPFASQGTSEGLSQADDPLANNPIEPNIFGGEHRTETSQPSLLEREYIQDPVPVQKNDIVPAECFPEADEDWLGKPNREEEQLYADDLGIQNKDSDGGQMGIGSSNVMLDKDDVQAPGGSREPPTEQDLASRWQAALEEGDLLDDEDNGDFFPNHGQGTGEVLPWNELPSGGAQESFSAVLMHDQTGTEPEQYAINQDNSGFHVGANPPVGRADFSPTGTQPSLRTQDFQPIQAPHAEYSGGMHVAGSQRGSRPTHVSNNTTSYYPSYHTVQQNQTQQYLQAWDVQQQQHGQRPEANRAQSFADKSKGGYSSPYDLPMDITKPRKRATAQHPSMVLPSQRVAQPGMLPPRSSSMFTTQTLGGGSGPVQPPMPGRSVSHVHFSQPPRQSNTASQSGLNKSLPPPPHIQATQSTSNFFEDLPTNSKPRQSSGSSGRYTPSANFQPPPNIAPPLSNTAPQSMPNQGFASESIPLPLQSNAVAVEQLRVPERMNPFPPSVQAPPVPPQNQARYSPAPPQAPVQSRSKYAPIPSGAPSSTVLPHQPRTSSPFAHHDRSLQGRQPTQLPAPPVYSVPESQLLAQTEQQPQPSGNMDVSQKEYLSQSLDQDHFEPQGPNGYNQFPASTQQLDARSVNSQPSPGQGFTAQQTPGSSLSPTITHLDHAPQGEQHPSFTPNLISPPPRSLTQSPGAAFAGPVNSIRTREPLQRPASVNVLPSAAHRLPMTGLRPRAFSQKYNYIVPNDGREHDPLSRWRGCPIFSWGFGGTVVTCFPKEAQRYTSGQQFPAIKCSPGEVKTQPIKDILPLEEHIPRFPGPLRAKTKKKEVVAWLSSRIDQLGGMAGPVEQSTDVEDDKRRSEKLLLLKVLRVLIETDAAPGGTDAAHSAVRAVFASHIPELNENATSGPDGAQLPGELPNVSHSQNIANIAQPAAIANIRKALLRGERENAIWLAADKGLWGHAMLIASTASRDLWKQVVQEFVRQEVRRLGEGTQSLAALYEIFAGNLEESIDELVPSSARAGLQMVSTNAESTSTKNALAGLDRWSETLAMVLNNRSPEDGQALVALGRLLIGYRRPEAAHICYIFAGPFAAFGGADDVQTSIALVGDNHLLEPFSVGKDLDSILLSEVYEYGLGLAASTSNPAAPHLQAFKFYHAFQLAEHGYRGEAQQYCDAIATNIKSSTKLSSYYHGFLSSALEDLMIRLQQAPRDGSSWISKPSMEKVSGSFLAKFHSFVAGDDEKAASDGAENGGEGVGPFARIAGGTPTISQQPSRDDLGSLYKPNPAYTAGGNIGASGATSRYSPRLPANASASQGLLHQTAPHYGAGNIPIANYNAHGILPASEYGARPPEQPQSNEYPPASAYQPTSPQQAQYSGIDSHNHSLKSLPNQSTYVGPEHGGNEPGFYQPQVASNQAPASQFTDRSDQSGANEGYTPVSYGYQPPSYEPPTSFTNSYEPPSSAGQNGSVSYNDDVPKKSIMDDNDDDIGSRAAEVLKKEKARKDKDAEENFKKAAAEDAKRVQQDGEKKGWFGGWFGGKKEQSIGPGPIKAKLGEESSFYYDKELKKWVNKKGDSNPTASTATPPPPKARLQPMPRVSSAPPPPSAIRQTLPQSSTPDLRSANAAAVPQGPITRPPLPSSSLTVPAPILSNGSTAPQASSPSTATIDTSDTVQPDAADGGSASTTNGPGLAASAAPAAPAAGPGPAPTPPAAAPPSRPATSMSNASSIDDLLGPPGAGGRKAGGTIKKAKKGRYVDVMAK